MFMLLYIHTYIYMYISASNIAGHVAHPCGVLHQVLLDPLPGGVDHLLHHHQLCLLQGFA